MHVVFIYLKSFLTGVIYPILFYETDIYLGYNQVFCKMSLWDTE